MKNFKRCISSILLIAILLVSVSALAGCYVVDSGKMSSIVGTYELTNYYTNKNEIETRGIKLYIVLTSDGNGYYAYSDNNTPLYYSEMKCRYTQDPEKSGYYEYVEIDFRGNGDWNKLGINAKLTSKTLNSNLPKYKGNIFEGTFGIDYYTSVGFTKVSRATDFSFIKNQIGEGKLLPYGATRLGGTYFYGGQGSDNSEFLSSEAENPFVYLYVNLDVYSGKGEAWYMLKSDEEKKNVTFDLAVTGGSQDYSLTLGDKTASISVSGSYVQNMRIPVSITVDGTDYSAYYELIFGGTRDVDAEIEEKLTSYENSKAE